MGGLADRLAATVSRQASYPYRWTSDRPVVSREGRVFGRPGNRQALNRGAGRLHEGTHLHISGDPQGARFSVATRWYLFQRAWAGPPWSVQSDGLQTHPNVSRTQFLSAVQTSTVANSGAARITSECAVSRELGEVGLLVPLTAWEPSLLCPTNRALHEIAHER
jgi:hypothetical protein